MNRALVIVIGLLLLVTAVGGAYLVFRPQPKTAPAAPTTSTTSTASSTSSSATNPTSAATSTTPATSSSILSADSSIEADASKRRYAAAQDKAKQWSSWKQNAVFSGLFMTFTSTLELNSTNEVYVFDSPDDTQNHYTVSVAQASGSILRAIIPTADYQGSLQPINPQFWQSNYVDAVQFADKNGGHNFMTNNSVTTVDVNLFRTGSKNFLLWVVTYHTKDTAKSLSVKMDANTKTLVTD